MQRRVLVLGQCATRKGTRASPLLRKPHRPGGIEASKCQASACILRELLFFCLLRNYCRPGQIRQAHSLPTHRGSGKPSQNMDQTVVLVLPKILRPLQATPLRPVRARVRYARTSPCRLLREATMMMRWFGPTAEDLALRWTIYPLLHRTGLLVGLMF